MENKFCFSCKTLKSKKEFSIANGRSDGCSVYCKVCTAQKNAEKYASKLAIKKCIVCGTEFTGLPNKLCCSGACAHIKLKKGIDGYHSCPICSKEFPFRKTLIKRGQRGIAYATQKYCSNKCRILATIERNKLWKPTAEMNRALGLRATALFKGKKFSEERRKAIKGRNAGSKSHFWKGGIAPINKVIRNSLELRMWRESVFARDDFTCQFCGQRGGKLNADHIKSFADFPELRTSIENGRTLCVPCHKTTDTYGGRYLRKLG